MSTRIAVIGEARGDFEVARILIDEVILQHVDWVSEETLDDHRQYVGLDDTETFTTWHTIDTSRGNDFRQAVRGNFGEGLPNNEVSTRLIRVQNQFLSLATKQRPMPYLVLVKDTDNKDYLIEALQEFRRQMVEQSIVVGAVHTEQECWLLAAFEPQNDEEQYRLNQCLGDFPPGVGFNPCVLSHQLTATKKDSDKLSPKRVYHFLTNGATERGFTGFHRDHHDRLKQRGQRNGLSEFIGDLEQRLLWHCFSVRVSISQASR